MDDHTFQSRVAALINKCKKAIRLYTSMGRRSEGELLSGTDRQIQIWRQLNEGLLGELRDVLQQSGRRPGPADIYPLRDRYGRDFRRAETEVHRKQQALIRAAENGDFNKCALLSNDLITLKAERQANRAVHQELEMLLSRTKTTGAVGGDLGSDERASEDEPERSPLLQQAKVIPLRRQGSS